MLFPKKKTVVKVQYDPRQEVVLFPFYRFFKTKAQLGSLPECKTHDLFTP